MEIRSLLGGSAAVCGDDLDLGAAARAMTGRGIGSLAVVRDGRLVGILTERDVLAAVAEDTVATDTVRDRMTPDPDWLTPEVEVGDAAAWMMAAGYRHLPVMEDGRLLGIVSIKDVLWAITAGEEARP